jgi:hypothetical protein
MTIFYTNVRDVRPCFHHFMMDELGSVSIGAVVGDLKIVPGLVNRQGTT